MRRFALAAVLAGLACLPPWTATLLAAAPTYIGEAHNGCSGACAVVDPANYQADDILLVVIETSGGEQAQIANANGFAMVPGAEEVSNAGGTQGTIYWKRATSSTETILTLNDSGDHQGYIIMTFRGCIATGDPWDVQASSAKGSASTTTTWDAVTTTVADTLVVNIATRDNDDAGAHWSAPSNASLANVTERVDIGWAASNGGGAVLITGEKATAGNTGATTATVTSTVNTMFTLALKPAAGGGGGSTVPAAIFNSLMVP